MKKALVLGAGGFIGSHLVKRLTREGYSVRGVDLKYPDFSESYANNFTIGDLRDINVCKQVIRFGHEEPFDEIYQLAADMGGAGYLFTGKDDADIMHNSVLINLNILKCIQEFNEKTNTNKTRIFYSSSACVYPEYNQEDPDNPQTPENSVYPAQPDSEYGWEKLFSEHLYFAFHKNYKINICIARYHGIFGPEGTWGGGREKAVAALCRKIAMVEDFHTIDIWGDGKQTRSFLYIDECLEGTLRLMRSKHTGPFNIGSDEMISIDELANMIAKIAGKTIRRFNHIKGPLGVRGRTSDNKLIYDKLRWKPCELLIDGLRKTYPWILEQVEKNV